MFCSSKYPFVALFFVTFYSATLNHSCSVTQIQTPIGLACSNIGYFQIIQRMKDSGKSYHGPLRRTVVKLASHGHVDAAYKLFTDNFDNTDVLKSIQRTVVINLVSFIYGSCHIISD